MKTTENVSYPLLNQLLYKNRTQRGGKQGIFTIPGLGWRIVIVVKIKRDKNNGFYVPLQKPARVDLLLIMLDLILSLSLSQFFLCLSIYRYMCLPVHASQEDDYSIILFKFKLIYCAARSLLSLFSLSIYLLNHRAVLRTSHSRHSRGTLSKPHFKLSFINIKRHLNQPCLLYSLE